MLLQPSQTDIYSKQISTPNYGIWLYFTVSNEKAFSCIGLLKVSVMNTSAIDDSNFVWVLKL
jgi:hypothetical protein